MKIIVATGQYPPTISGIATLSNRLTTCFRREGHDVEVITEGEGCRRVGRVAVLDSEGRSKISKGADILQVIGPTPVFTEQCVSFGKRKGLRVVYKLDVMPGLQTFHAGRIAAAIDHVYEGLWLPASLRGIDFVVFSTHDVASRYGFYQGPFEVISSGIDECQCPSTAGSVRWVEGDIDSSHAKVALLFVGQLRRYKGVDSLIDGVALLNKRMGPRFTLTIIGSGPDRDSLAERARRLGVAQAITFRGSVTDTELHGAYRSHDILVLPSVSAESFGLVLIEARRHGMMVVTTDLPGPREVAKALGGVLINPGDSESISTGILEAMGKAAEQPILPFDTRPFLWPVIAHRYLTLYARLIAESNHL